MQKQLKLSSDVGDSGSKKFKRGYGDACDGVWLSLGFGKCLASVPETIFSHLIYFIKTFLNFILLMRFAKIMLL
jgi:hypothetical protein